ncbi:MAG: caspase family protein [Syntrophobacteraceae bacterium]
MADNDYAVVVGISRYLALPELSGPVNDALSFHRWLHKCGGVPKKNIKLIITAVASRKKMTRKNASPLRDQVISALDDIRTNRGPDGKVGRRLYLFLAGHGYSSKLDDVALLMANAGNPSYPAIPGADVAKWFRASAEFDEIVLVMDCCREECRTIPHQPVPWEDVLSPNAGSVRYFNAFSAQPFLWARERIISDGKVRGIFTHALLTAFELAPPDPVSGGITGSAVKNYVLNYMRTIIDTQYQEPEMPIDTARDIVLCRPARKPELTLELHFGPACRGNARIVDSNLDEIWSGSIPDDRILRRPLLPGKYRIDMADGSGGKRFDVMGAPGEVVHVQV